MGILSTNAEVSNELNLPGYSVPNQPDKTEIQKLRDYLKSSKTCGFIRSWCKSR